MFTEGHSRPPPPSRRRRSSVAVALSFDDLAELRSFSDEQLCLTDHGTLLCALKLQWDENDQMAGRVEAAHGDEQGLRNKLEDTLGALSEAVARYEEGLQDQDRLESEVQGRNELLDRLRQRLTTKDTELRDSERRYAEQERSFEAERQAFISQEAHLKAQVHSRTIPLRHPNPAPDLDDARVEALQDELQTMMASQQALQNHLGALTQELQDVKKVNTQLREDNDGWQALLTDQTMSGTVRKGSGMLSRVLSDGSGDLGIGRGTPRKRRPNVRQHMMEVESNEMATVTDDTEGDDPLHTSGLASNQSHGESLEGIPVTGSGLDLAAELGRAEVSQGGEMRTLGKGDEGEALRAEVKHLRDANKALSMYCSKIIDRIIAKEGYEDILAADYAQDDLGIKPRSREVSRTSRVPVKTLTQPLNTSPIESPQQTTLESSSEKRSRRGLSMDWGLGKFFQKSFTDPSQPAPVATKPGLRPLSLSSKPAGLPAMPMGARKLEAHDEDEEDARERHRMQAALKLMGVTAGQTASTEKSAERGAGRYWLPGLHKPATSHKEATSPPNDAPHKIEATHSNI